MTALAGKLALITGASRGIGAATALALARRGARVVLVARGRPELEATAHQIAAAGGQAWVYPCDLADTAAIASLAQAVRATAGPPDVLVNNAGTGEWRFTEETSAEAAAAMMALPYLAAFNLTRALLPAMLERRSGHIAKVTSAAAFRALPGPPPTTPPAGPCGVSLKRCGQIWRARACGSRCWPPAPLPRPASTTTPAW